MEPAGLRQTRNLGLMWTGCLSVLGCTRNISCCRLRISMYPLTPLQRACMPRLEQPRSWMEVRHEKLLPSQALPIPTSPSWQKKAHFVFSFFRPPTSLAFLCSESPPTLVVYFNTTFHDSSQGCAFLSFGLELVLLPGRGGAGR